MKPKIFFLFLLGCVVGTTGFAQSAKTASSCTKSIQLNESYNSLFIENTISVVLTEGSSTEIKVQGDMRDVKKVMAKVTDGNLVLYTAATAKTDVTVYVPANLLNKVVIADEGTLRSETVLQNKKLRILVGGECRVNVKSSGKVTVEAEDGIDFVQSR